MSDEQIPGIPAEEKEEWSRIATIWKSSFKKAGTWLRLLEFLLIISFGFVAGQGLDTRHVVERCNNFIAETYMRNTEYQQCLHLVTGDRLPEINEPGMFLNFSHAEGEPIQPLGEPSKNVSYQWQPSAT